MVALRHEDMSNYAVRVRPRAVRRMGRALVVFAAAIALAGCGGDGNEQATEQAAPAEVRNDGRAAPDSFAAEAGGAGDAAVNARSGTDGRAGQAGDDVKIAPEDRALVYTAEMTVRADDVATAAEKSKQLVLAAGGYVAEERSDSSGGESNATLVFKVPPDRYPTVLSRLGRDLGRQETLRQHTEDVTEQVADVASRVKSAEAALDQMRTLLSKAEKIGEVLEIEREISARTAELESLQARQKALAERTSMATVTLTLIGPAAPAPDDEEGLFSGFLDGLRSGLEALGTAVRIGLIIFGVLVPWLVVGGVIALVARPVLRRLRPARRRAAAPPPRPDRDAEETLPSHAGEEERVGPAS
jgi:hypothetical protein